jgi:hypothetical protein
LFQCMFSFALLLLWACVYLRSSHYLQHHAHYSQTLLPPHRSLMFAFLPIFPFHWPRPFSTATETHPLSSCRLDDDDNNRNVGVCLSVYIKVESRIILWNISLKYQREKILRNWHNFYVPWLQLVNEAKAAQTATGYCNILELVNKDFLLVSRAANLRNIVSHYPTFPFIPAHLVVGLVPFLFCVNIFEF